jgi:hypothetical protein
MFVDPAHIKAYQSHFFDVGLMVFFTIFAQTYAPRIKQSCDGHLHWPLIAPKLLGTNWLVV